MSEEREPDQSNAGPEQPASESQTEPSQDSGSEGSSFGSDGGSGDDGGLGQSSLGMEANIAALLACSLGFITGILFIILEKDSRFVRFWAWQVTAISGVWFIVGIALNFLPCIGTVISLLMVPVGLVLWIMCMLKAYQGETWKLPLVGDFAEQQAG